MKPKYKIGDEICFIEISYSLPLYMSYGIDTIVEIRLTQDDDPHYVLYDKRDEGEECISEKNIFSTAKEAKEYLLNYYYSEKENKIESLKELIENIENDTVLLKIGLKEIYAMIQEEKEKTNE